MGILDNQFLWFPFRFGGKWYFMRNIVTMYLKTNDGKTLPIELKVYMSRKGKTPKKYKIRTFQDIADIITVDNYTNFMTDLGQLLEMVMAMKALRDKQVESGKLQPEDALLAFPEFTWKDGDKHANFINLKLPTGKVKKVNIEEFFKKLDNYNIDVSPQKTPETSE